MKKFLVISAIALAAFSAFCAGTKKFGKMKDSDWVVTNAWQAMQHHVKPDGEWATNHFDSVEFSNAVGKVQRKVDIPVKSVNGKTGDVVLNASDVHALPDTFTETDPTVPLWAKQPNPPEGMTDNALVFTNGAVVTKDGTAITPGNIGAASASSVLSLQSSKLDKADVINPANATTNGPAADAKATKDALDAKLATVCPYDLEHPEYGGSTLRWINGYSGLGFGYDVGGKLYSEITFTDTPYGEIRHVGHVNPDRPWSWITIGDSTNENTLQDALDAKADKADISADNPTFSNAVLSVGLNIDTNSVAVLNDIAETFGGFPIEGTATTVGGLLAALAAAVAWLKKNKVGSFASVGGATATVDNGIAKLSDFFTNSNSLLTGTIESKVNSMFDNGDTTNYPRS